MVCMLTAAKMSGVPFEAIVIKGIKNEGHLQGLERSDLIVDTGRPDYSDRSKSLLARSDGPVYSFIGGTQHVGVSLRRLVRHASEPEFDLVLAEDPHLPLDVDAEIVPHDAVRDALRQSFRGRLKLLHRLRDLTNGSIYQFELPPPVSDDWMQAWLARRPLETTEGVGLPGRFLRFKLWRVASQLFREEAESVGATFVERPGEAVDDEGFMRDELVRNMTHGNEAYGELLLQQARSLA